MKRICLLLLCLTLLHSALKAQYLEVIDSLELELKKPQPDSQKIYIYRLLVAETRFVNPEKALKYADEGISLCDKNNEKYTRAGLVMQKGIIASIQGDVVTAQELFLQSLDEFKAIDSKKGMAMVYGCLGQNYSSIGDNEKYFFYTRLYLQSAYDARDTVMMVQAANNMGVVYSETNQLDSSELMYRQIIDLGTQIGYNEILPMAYSNLGEVLRRKDLLDEAKNMAIKGVRLSDDMDQLSDKAFSNYSLGVIYFDLGKYDSSLFHFNNALKFSEDVGDLNTKYLSVEGIAHNLFEKGDYKAAYITLLDFVELKDSVIREENVQMAHELDTKYQAEKRTLEIEKLNEEKKLSELEREREKTQKIIIISGLFIAILFGLSTFLSLRRKTKDNKIITSQKNEILHQKEIVEEKNKEILDSITYAKRIQAAILPPSKLVREYLPDSFILYMPKDIVAGDFYWMEPSKEKIIFAAADCTGHGVPGAMVSVVCNNSLNRAVREFALKEPGKILDMARNLVVEEFEKSEEEVKDGMDISLCSIDPLSGDLLWSGANNPLWVYRSEEGLLEEFKPDKQPIGKFSGAVPFTTHQVTLKNNDTVFIFTDGFQDQFGGEKGKKFKASKMKELILQNSSLSMEELKEVFLNEFVTWKGKLEQVDDVCVIGYRFIAPDQKG